MRWGREPAGRIFISYRRADSRGVAGRLGDTLGAYFGHGRVFRDIEDIEGGADFHQVIEGNLSTADAMIVLIGPDWASAVDDDGRRRLDDPDDWVTAEVGAAIESGVPIFPVLVDDTPMPREEDLPARLTPLTRHNAISISDQRWKSDTTRLAKIVALDIPGSVAERRLNRTRILILVMLFAAVAFTTTSVVLNSRNLLAETIEGVSPTDNPDERLLAAWASAVNYVAIMASAILLLISAPLVDEERRRWVYTGAGVAIVGCFLALVMYWKPLDGIDETIGLFLISTLLATALLGFMNLSGFKPK